MSYFSHSDHEAQPWGGPKADISEAFRPTSIWLSMVPFWAGCENVYDDYVKYRPISTSTRKLSLIIITIVKLRVPLAEIIKS